MKYLLKFGYDGTKFSGYQRGNGENSIEDSIIEILIKFQISDDLQSAARTDRNVSAAGNVLSVASDERPEKIIGILNSQTENMFFHSYAAVPDDFNPRYNRIKHYRYTLIKPDYDKNELEALLAPFVGKHDFAAFSRKDNRNSVRTIEKIEVTEVSGVVYVDFFGKSFVWNQIRSIMAFAHHYLSTQEEPPDPFSLTERFPYISDPRALILMDIEYEGIQFIKFFSAGKLENEKEKQYYLKMNSLVRENIIEKIRS